MNRANLQTYDMHPMSRGMYWLLCVLALVCGVTALVESLRVTDGRWIIGGLGVLFVMCGLGMFVCPQTVVDSSARVVRRHSRLFGRFLFWSRQYPFSDFRAVVILSKSDGAAHVSRPIPHLTFRRAVRVTGGLCRKATRQLLANPFFLLPKCQK